MNSPQSAAGDSCPDSPPGPARQRDGSRTPADPADMDRHRRKRKAGEEPTPHKVIEKRRRDRINQRFEELRGLVPTARNSQGVKNDKVDLLHMTIEHLKTLTGRTSPVDRENDENCPQQTSAPPARGVIFTATDAVLAGFSECAYEALQFLLHEEHMPEDSELVVSLRSHLRNSQMSLDVHRVLQTHLPHPTFDSAPPQRLMTPPRHAVDMPLPPSPHTMQSPSQPTASRSELAMPATPQPPVPTTYPNSPAVVHSFSPAKLPSSPGVQISLQQQAAVGVPNSPGVQLGMQHRLTPPCTTPNSTMSLPNVTPLTVAMATSTVARVTASAAMATSSPSPGPVMPIFAYLPPRSYGYGMPTPPPPPPPQYANGPPVSPYQPVFVGWLPPPPQPPPQ
ncbi:PREDICTED: hairy/enhancer-of-split related with YRPW motif protein 1-like [Branchiostoma belcheri]|uniref:Hairy/enhancer-of-split related with YRPW motif protein 1-like n=1 Tax=Branchiostoma belcheri TaxID=7741 RepID=A0A6P5AXM8_BRABE|nr:PREDICTED: hairy/enhancer-of-split related with YRPW motif protein 1-like [Branchiostoma belcheri]